jgi:hypothetical protein
MTEAQLHEIFASALESRTIPDLSDLIRDSNILMRQIEARWKARQERMDAEGCGPVFAAIARLKPKKLRRL